MIRTSLLLLALAIGLNAQTRNVVLSWSASTSSTIAGFQGYNVYRATSATGPFTTPLNATPISAVTYTDSTAVIGSTYTYQVTAVAIACTPTTPATSVCGSSVPSPQATTTVPQSPATTFTISAAVQ